MPVKLIISGAPASGKGTQCEFIKKEYGVIHLSTGDMLREAIKAETSVGLRAKEFVENGKLVPDEVICDVVLARVQQPDCIEFGWLLDGFPRTAGQAEALAKAGVICDAFIQMDVPDELLLERVTGRRLDPDTGKIYHLKFSPPETEEIAARLFHRPDDTEEKFGGRIKAYHENLSSILSLYREKMVQITVTSGSQTPEMIFTDIKNGLATRLANTSENAPPISTPVVGSAPDMSTESGLAAPSVAESHPQAAVSNESAPARTSNGGCCIIL